MEIKKFDLQSKEMEVARSWWHERMDLPLPNVCISDYGYMGYLSDRPICCIFFFPVMGCKMAMLGYPISSPSSTKDERTKVLSGLVVFVESMAKALGYEFLVSYPGNQAAQKRFKEFGYMTGDPEVIQMLKKL